ncbi:ABC transporter ATP-binding protein [Candidatus Riflebacteria bacterium]
MENHKIEVKNVKKCFQIGQNQFEALKEINLKIEDGEFLGLVGPSGSGKTTLLNLLGGLDSPTEGDVFVEGKKLNDMDANSLADFRNESIGFIFQSFNLLPVYTAYENVEFPLLLQKSRTDEEIKKLVSEILEKVGLGDKMDKIPATLSGGECQRVAIARAMVKNPSIVLADEPTANLDAENSHAILKVLEKLNEEMGTTFVFSTHDEKVMKYLKRVVRLIDGRVEKDETLKKGN